MNAPFSFCEWIYYNTLCGLFKTASKPGSNLTLELELVWMLFVYGERLMHGWERKECPSYLKNLRHEIVPKCINCKEGWFYIRMVQFLFLRETHPIFCIIEDRNVTAWCLYGLKGQTYDHISEKKACCFGYKIRLCLPQFVAGIHFNSWNEEQNFVYHLGSCNHLKMQ